MGMMAMGKFRRLARRSLITMGLEASHLLSSANILRPSNRAGLIFTMHHVRPFDTSQDFHPNQHLEITPEFLATTIEYLKGQGFDFIRLCDVPERLNQMDSKRPFAVLTLDDGYRNNRDYALPVFERYNVPATIFVTPGFAERSTIIWWELLANLLRQQDELAFDFGYGVERQETKSVEQKIHVFNRFCDAIWSLDEQSTVEYLDLLCQQYGIDTLALTEELTLSSQELAELSRHPLIDLGAHGQNHLAIGRLPRELAAQEISQSVAWLSQLTGETPKSLAFPYGNAAAANQQDFQLVQDLGLPIALTTRPGMIRTDRLVNLSALPRVSINGHYQKSRYIAALASGIPFRWSQY